MKVYYVTDIKADDWSAPAVHVDEICKNMALQECEVILYVPKDGLFEETKEYKVNLIRVPKTLRAGFLFPILFARLFRDIEKNRPDVIYSRHSYMLVVPVLVGRLFKIPVILEVNEQLNTDATFRHDAVSLFLRFTKIPNLIEHVNFTLASKLITVTEGIRSYLISHYSIPESKIITITNGVDVNRFKPIPNTRESMKLDRDILYIGYIGTFLSWQGLRYVVEAARLLSSERAKIKFKIIGYGIDSDYLISYVTANSLSDFVEIHPPIPHDLVPLYINSFDICLSYPIKLRAGITSPFKIYEYLACGRPVVSADILGMKEEFGDVLYYSEPESPESLSKSLIELIDNKELRHELGIKGRRFVEMEHSWNAVTKRIIQVCLESMNA